MAKGKATPASFKKGDPRASKAGKKSSRALPQDLKEAREQNAKEFEASLYKYMKLNMAELKAAYANPSTPARDLAVIKILEQSINKGDQQRLNFLLERTIGKVKDVSEVEITGLHKTLVDLLNEE